MTNKQKIIPNLWFDGNAEEAVKFYTTVFPESCTKNTMNYPDSQDEGLADFQTDMAGKVLTIDFSLSGYNFAAINAGPEFKPTAASSFMINFDPSRDENAREYIYQIWQKLVNGGEVLMPLDKYNFSEHYGWLKDKYGFSWQLILTNPAGEERPFIIPSLMFGDIVQNRASEARDFYTSIFKNSKKGASYPYGQPTGPASAEALMFADFMIENQWFAANDSGVEQNFTFTEAVSYSIACQDQTEIDYYWDNLSSYPENEQCGWCKDKFGVSWQIVPQNMIEIMSSPDAYKIMMNQKKIVIAEYGS